MLNGPIAGEAVMPKDGSCAKYFDHLAGVQELPCDLELARHSVAIGAVEAMEVDAISAAQTSLRNNVLGWVTSLIFVFFLDWKLIHGTGPEKS